tara:strand:+ start:623 stop:925 length:303 start_codon:yes stop_codon:yes gene_type:complete
MSIQLQPRNDRVIVRADAEEETSAGGIVLAPSAAKDKPQQGTVVAVGAGKRNERGDIQPMDIKPGDRVLYGKYSGSEVTVNGEELLVMREDDVVAIIASK